MGLATIARYTAKAIESPVLSHPVQVRSLSSQSSVVYLKRDTTLPGNPEPVLNNIEIGLKYVSTGYGCELRENFLSSFVRCTSSIVLGDPEFALKPSLLTVFVFCLRPFLARLALASASPKCPACDYRGWRMCLLCIPSDHFIKNIWKLKLSC